MPRPPTEDVQAYHLFLQGRRWVSEYTLAAIARAVEYFERAIAHDPTFALASANLAMAYVELAEHGGMAPEVAYARAADAAANALRLDPELGEAHCTAGYLKTVREFDWAGAEQEFKQALELTPSNADAHALYGRVLRARALRRGDRAPAARAGTGSAGAPAGCRDDAAPRRAVRTTPSWAPETPVELDPGHDRARATLGWAYLLSGRREEGLAELERAVALAPGNTLWLGQLGQACALAGQAAKAQAILRELEVRAQSAYVSRLPSRVRACGPRATRIRRWSAWRAPWRSAPGRRTVCKGSFLFRSLHAHPGFRALLRRMRLE